MTAPASVLTLSRVSDGALIVFGVSLLLVPPFLPTPTLPFFITKHNLAFKVDGV